jgi:hypothetical protein
MPSREKGREETLAGEKRSGKDPNLTTLTLSISIEDKDKLKMIALKQHKTVAKVIREWIAAYSESDL